MRVCVRAKFGLRPSANCRRYPKIRCRGRYSDNRRSDRGWKQLHNDEFLDLHFSPVITVRVITSKRMRWAGGGARVERGTEGKCLNGSDGDTATESVT